MSADPSQVPVGARSPNPSTPHPHPHYPPPHVFLAPFKSSLPVDCPSGRRTNLYDDLRKYYHKTGLQPGSSASGSSGTSTISRGSSSSSSSSSRSSSTSDSRARSSSRSLSSQDGDNTKETKFLSLRELGDAFKQLFRSETGRHSVIVVLWRGKAYVGRQGGNLERYIINRVREGARGLGGSGARGLGELGPGALVLTCACVCAFAYVYKGRDTAGNLCAGVCGVAWGCSGAGASKAGRCT